MTSSKSTKLTTKEYDLAASTKSVGNLIPILKAKDGSVIDGLHRSEEDSEWPSVVNPAIDTPLKLQVARLISNTNRREVSSGEKAESLRSIYEAYKAERGEYPKAEEIAETLGWSRSTVWRYLPHEFKSEAKVKGGLKSSEERSARSLRAEQAREKSATGPVADSGFVQTKEDLKEQHQTERQESPTSPTQVEAKKQEALISTSQATPSRPQTPSQPPPAKSREEDQKTIRLLKERMQALEAEKKNLEAALEKLQWSLSELQCPRNLCEIRLSPNGPNGKFQLVDMSQSTHYETPKTDQETPPAKAEEASHTPKSLREYTLKQVAEGADGRGRFSRWEIFVNGDGRIEARLSLSQRGGCLLSFTDPSAKPVQKSTPREVIEALPMGPMRGFLAVNLGKLEIAV